MVKTIQNKTKKLKCYTQGDSKLIVDSSCLVRSGRQIPLLSTFSSSEQISSLLKRSGGKTIFAILFDMRSITFNSPTPLSQKSVKVALCHSQLPAGTLGSTLSPLPAEQTEGAYH